jgi:hypothetical protein
MSTIGAANFGLASSIVGSSRPEAATNQMHAASAEQKARVDQKSLISSTQEDIADTEFGSDRDADGRLLYRRAASRPDADAEATGEGEDRTPRPADASGDRGKSLDLEA